MSLQVIVDDQSSQITYSGLWTTGGTSGNLAHTATSSRGAGASMTFPFSGTLVSVVGSFDANISCSGSFTLDDNSTSFVSPLVPAPLNHQTIWSSVPLSDGQHTLKYTLTSCTSPNTGGVWFDYILYSPSPNVSTTGITYFADDTSSEIDYSGNWVPETGNNLDFGLTSHRGQEGSSFSIDFTGTNVAVYGRIGNDSTGDTTQVSFTLDGTGAVDFSAPYQSSVSFNQPLFQSGDVAGGKHTLVGTTQSGTVWVDYLLLKPIPSTTIAQPSGQHHSSNIGEIAGIAVGAFVLAVIIALLVIFRRRLFKGRHPRRSSPTRPLAKPPAINVVRAREPAALSHHVPREPPRTSASNGFTSPVKHQGHAGITTYPPPVASSSSSRPRTADNHGPFDTPPVSPRAASFTTTTTSTADSQTRLLPPRRASVFSAFSAFSASNPPPSPPYTSGHSRRHPSLGGDGDSIADLKRRTQSAPPYDDNSSIAATSIVAHSIAAQSAVTVSGQSAVTGTSSVRPLPGIPPTGNARPPASSSRFMPDDPDDLPPVYTLR